MFADNTRANRFRLIVPSAKMLTLLAITLLGVVTAIDQSETIVNQPMNEPEVVVQLKYDGGELNRIYLTQFRKDHRITSVPARPTVCADLCHSGLGGEACGSTCSALMPIGLKTALNNGNVSTEQFGEPRVAVCPTLCENQLGHPLCACADLASFTHPTNWTMVCDAFCVTDGYVLNGCPTCEHSQPLHQAVTALGLRLDTAEGWQAWCNVQCRQGQGGAACNCDRTPF